VTNQVDGYLVTSIYPVMQRRQRLFDTLSICDAIDSLSAIEGGFAIVIQQGYRV
jgi:hypothetical protein